MHRPLQNVSALHQKNKGSAVPRLSSLSAYLPKQETRRNFLKVMGATAAVAAFPTVAIMEAKKEERRTKEGVAEMQKEMLQPTIDAIMQSAEKYGIDITQRSEGTRLLLCIELPRNNNDGYRPVSTSSSTGTRAFGEQEHDLLWMKTHFGTDASLMFNRMFADISPDYAGGWIDAQTEIDNIEWETKRLKRDGRIPAVAVEKNDERRFEEFRQTILQSDGDASILSSKGGTLGSAIITYEGEGIDRGGHTDSFATHAVKMNMETEIGEPTFAVLQMRLPKHETILAHEEKLRLEEAAKIAAIEQGKKETIDKTMRTVYQMLFKLAGR